MVYRTVVPAIILTLATACGGDGQTSAATQEGSATAATTSGQTSTGSRGDTTVASSIVTSTSDTADVGDSSETNGSSNGSTTRAGTDTDASTGSTGGAPSSFIAVTFNTGGHADGEADVADEWYGNGLSWTPAIEQTAAWLAALQPEVITFQEIFHSPDCADIPEEFHPGYVCETWSEGDPSVVQLILGQGYQVACNLGKTDKCAAVKTSFGSFVGCDSDFCVDGLDGAEIDGCGGGSRVGRGTIALTGGGAVTIVNFQGTSGILLDDQACRVAQIEQVFEDLDGQPAANGAVNLILGDFNTDPARAALLDSSAQRLNDFVGDGEPFHFITAVGTDVQPTYAGTFNIDHQISDTFDGECWHPGITRGYPAVVDFEYFDHVPAVCEFSLR